jgi:hypothetical protein
MSTFAIRTSQSDWNRFVEAITKEVEDHPAFYKSLKQPDAETLLIGSPPFSYLLWNDNQNNRFALSFMDSSLTVIHKFFVRLSPNNFYYQNGDPHRASLDKIISIIMHCKPVQCSMMANPLQIKR